MKNLSKYIEEKLIVNKDYSCDTKINYLDKNIDELYLIRFRPEEESIYIDIIRNLLIKPIVHYNIKRTEYELSGDFVESSGKYEDAQFTLDSHGFLYKLKQHMKLNMICCFILLMFRNLKNSLIRLLNSII